MNDWAKGCSTVVWDSTSRDPLQPVHRQCGQRPEFERYGVLFCAEHAEARRRVEQALIDAAQAHLDAIRLLPVQLQLVDQ